MVPSDSFFPHTHAAAATPATPAAAPLLLRVVLNPMLKRRGGELSLSHTQRCAVFDHIRLNSAEFCCKPHWASFGRVWPRRVLFEWPVPLIAQPCAARGRAGVGCVAADVGLLCSRERGGRCQALFIMPPHLQLLQVAFFRFSRCLRLGSSS